VSLAPWSFCQDTEAAAGEASGEAGVLGIRYGVALPQVKFEEDFSFQLDKVAGLWSESRWCSRACF